MLKLVQRRIALVLILPFLATACGGGGNSAASSSSATLSGNWQMTLKKTNTKLTRTQSGFLVQNKNVVTGGVIFTDIPCSGVGTVAGSVSGTNVAFTVGVTGLTINLSGALGSDQASMSGDYTMLASGCQAPSLNTQETGTWTANLVKPLSGNFSGTIKSSKLGILQITGQVSQGQNTGASEAPLTGSLSVKGYCFANASIAGVVSGTAVVINLVSASGVELAQVMGTSTLDGTSVTGTYHTVPQGTGGTEPCVDGDSGAVNISL
jgi:hypothetical protein